MPERTDILIVGGAVVGSAVAYHLAKLRFAGKITVVERDTTYAASSTARSAGGLRQQFSTLENIRLSLASLAIIKALEAERGAPGDAAFQEHGYLILASEAGRSVLANNVALQQSEGAQIALLEPDQMKQRFPWLNTEGLAAGGFGVKGEGWLDPSSLMNLLRKAATARGVAFLRDEVVGIDVEEGRVRSVQIASGGSIACDWLVNAAGPNAGAVARLAGISLPVEPRKRFVYVLDCRDAGEALRTAPLTVDPSGVWFGPEGRTFIAGRSPEASAEPGDKDLDRIDHDFFDQEIWPHLAQRVPAFEAIKVINAWAGFYDYNTLDQNGIVGPHPEIANFLFANGFSGHGLQQAPAVGRAIAELIVHGGYQSIDLSRLGYARIAQGKPLAEINVI